MSRPGARDGQWLIVAERIKLRAGGPIGEKMTDQTLLDPPVGPLAEKLPDRLG